MSQSVSILSLLLPHTAVGCTAGLAAHSYVAQQMFRLDTLGKVEDCLRCPQHAVVIPHMLIES